MMIVSPTKPVNGAIVACCRAVLAYQTFLTDKDLTVIIEIPVK